MLRCSNIFSDYKPCLGKDKVRVADGCFSPISGKGTIYAAPLLSLSSVLNVPNFSHNLLPISRITQVLSCSVTFFPS